jgi:hypothetical protein
LSKTKIFECSYFIKSGRERKGERERKKREREREREGKGKDKNNSNYIVLLMRLNKISIKDIIILLLFKYIVPLYKTYELSCT